MAQPPNIPILCLRKALGRALKQGHPWVYRDALAQGTQLESGSLVMLAETPKGPPLAWGYWDAESPIAVRVLGMGPVLPESRVPAEIQARLEHALGRRLDRLDLGRTNAFRWAHGEADALPGIHVDVYGPSATIRYDGQGAQGFYAQRMNLPALLIAAGAPAQIQSVVERKGRGQANVTGPGASKEPFVVFENSLRFTVDLVNGQKGGLFLDQRENRARLADHCVGKRVLNLFGYTGAFSVYAAAAGATFTDTVDIAAQAIVSAKANFQENQLNLDRAAFHPQDAFAFLQSAIEKKQRWDVVITDPPSFAPNERSLEVAKAAYRRLHGLACQVVAEGGLLAAASCSSHVNRKLFLETVVDGATAAGCRFELDFVAGAGFDHPVISAFPEGDYLKFALGRVLHHHQPLTIR